MYKRYVYHSAVTIQTGTTKARNNKSNNNNADNAYGAEPIREFTRSIWRVQTQR